MLHKDRTLLDSRNSKYENVDHISDSVAMIEVLWSTMNAIETVYGTKYKPMRGEYFVLLAEYGDFWGLKTVRDAMSKRKSEIFLNTLSPEKIRLGNW